MKTITISKPDKMKALAADELEALGMKAKPDEDVIREYGKYPCNGYVIFHKIAGKKGYYKAEKPILIMHSYSYGMSKEKYLEGIGECIDEYETDMMALFGEGDKK